jgi:hypothetical protein
MNLVGFLRRGRSLWLRVYRSWSYSRSYVREAP